jgi:lysophospholipase L1-like esterase
MRRGWAAVCALLLLVLTACSTPPASEPSPSPTASRPGLDVPVHARAYFFGDSWTEGLVARRGRGFPYVTSELLGWTPIVDGVGGTGYLAHFRPSTQPYPVRAEAIPARTDADIVIVAGGLNDAGIAITGLKPAVRQTLTTIRTRFPGKPIVVLGPGPNALPVKPVLSQVDRIIRDAAAEAGMPYISPIERNWITGLNFRDVIDGPTRHPSTAGHAYLGGRLAVALQDLIDEPQNSDVASPAEVEQRTRVG